MLAIKSLFTKLRNKDQGVTALEYALIAALIAAAVVGTVGAVGTSANTTFGNVSGAMNAAGN